MFDCHGDASMALLAPGAEPVPLRRVRRPLVAGQGRGRRRGDAGAGDVVERTQPGLRGRPDDHPVSVHPPPFDYDDSIYRAAAEAAKDQTHGHCRKCGRELPLEAQPLDQGALPAAPPDHGRRLDGVLPRLPRRGARLPLLPRRRRCARGLPQGLFGNRGDPPAPARSGAPEPHACGTGRVVRGPVGSTRHRRGEAALRRGLLPLHALEA